MSDAFLPDERNEDHDHRPCPQDTRTQQHIPAAKAADSATSVDSPTPSSTGFTLPHDILTLIARHVRDAGALGTLATMRLLSTDTSSLITPILYENLSFGTMFSPFLGRDTSLERFLKAHTRRPPPLAPTAPNSTDKILANRRKKLFNRVRTIRLDSVDEDRTCDAASMVVSLVGRSGDSLFSSAHTVFLRASMLEQFIDDYVLDNLPGPWAFLRRLAQPVLLSVVDGWVETCYSVGCTRNDDLTIRDSRAHQSEVLRFLSQLRRCWPSLKRVHWGSPHVRYPHAIAGVDNLYDTSVHSFGPRDASAVNLWHLWVHVIKEDSPPEKTKFRIRGSEDAIDTFRSNLEKVDSDNLAAAPGRTPVELDIVYEVV